MAYVRFRAYLQDRRLYVPCHPTVGGAMLHVSVHGEQLLYIPAGQGRAADYVSSHHPQALTRQCV